MRKLTERKALSKLFEIDYLIMVAPLLRLKPDDLEKEIKKYMDMQTYILNYLERNKNKTNRNMPEIDEIGDLFKNFDSKTKPF